MSKRKDYEQMGSETEELSGWDFSSVNIETEEAEKNWDYQQIVEDHLSSNQVLLDIGTGGGEFLLRIADQVQQAYGIDSQQKMIDTARRNWQQSDQDNVKLKVGDNQKLPFNDNKIDLALCRQAPFSSREIARVLKEEGTFITQQVRENDKQNIKEAFTRGQNFQQTKDALLREKMRDLKRAGFTIARQETYNATTYLQSREDLVRLLKWSPIIPDFDPHVKKDRASLEKIEANYTTEKGIKTNTSRFLIIARN